MPNHLVEIFTGFQTNTNVILWGARSTSYLPIYQRLSSQKFGGNGFIAGQFPGTVTVDGNPAQRQIECRVRSHNRTTTHIGWSNPDGTYRFDWLNPDEEYDLIARDHNRVYSDVIVPAIKPWPYVFSTQDTLPSEIIAKDFTYTFDFRGGLGPYQLIDVSVPGGVTVTIDGIRVTVTGVDVDDGVIQFTVIDSDEGSITFNSIITANLVRAYHWRIFIEEMSGISDYAGITEIEFREIAGGPSLTNPSQAITAAFASSHVNIWNVPEYAFDGTYDNGWLSATNTIPQWIGYSFSDPVSIRQVAISGSWNHTNGSPKKFIIQYSDDMATWTDALAVDNQTGWTGGTDTRVFNL